MLIFFKPRLVLFAVEKTATSALQQALQDEADVKLFGIDPAAGRYVSLKHVSFQDYKHDIEPGILDKVTGPLDYVGVIREPVSWLRSWYCYRQRDMDAGTTQSTRGIGFDQFVQEFCSNGPEPYARTKTQSAKLCDAAGRVGLTHLFRYDEFDKLVSFLEERLGHKIAIDRVNVSPTVEVGALSPETMALLRTTHAADFDIYESV